MTTLDIPRGKTDPSADCLPAVAYLHSIIRDKITGNPAPTEVNAAMAQLRQVIDLREKIAELDRELSQRRESLERILLDFHETSGLEQLRAGGLSITFNPALRPRIDPEKWDGIYEWAVHTGNTQCLYRQVAQAKFLELIEQGSQMPEGVTVESYTKINTRRV